MSSRAARRDIRVGRLDLRRERVRPVRHSRLFDDRHFRGYVPMSLLPEDAEWLWDVGSDAMSVSDGGWHRYSNDGRYSTDFGVDVRYSRESRIQLVE